MDTYDPSQEPRFTRLLIEREAALRAALHELDHLPADGEGIDAHEVRDTKDLAVERTLERLDQANAHRLEAELAQVITAHQRLMAHSYGHCLSCEKPIDLRRLIALPASAYCTACQSSLESEKKRHHPAL
jgi:DnaK suppressor protein